MGPEDPYLSFYEFRGHAPQENFFGNQTLENAFPGILDLET